MNEAMAINVKNLSKKLKKNQALDNISLFFDSGLMHGVIGPEGAGKTTLMRLLSGLLKPNSGEIHILRGKTPIALKDIRFKIAYMPQNPSLYPDLSVEEHLDFFQKLYCLSEKEYLNKKHTLLKITRLSDFLERPAGQLSGGMSKKLGLMCALLHSPEILLLDEPTNGVDPISRREFWDLLYQLLDQNILIIVSTAYMDEAERCGKVHLLESGKVIRCGEPRALLQESKVKSFDDLFIQEKNG